MHPRPAKGHVTLADHRRGHMRQRRQIAGSAHGTFLGNDRNDALDQHRFDKADQFRAHARSAAAERDQLQGHDQADNVFRQRVADTAAMRQDQIALERPHIGGVDADRSKLAEPGVDAIDRRAAGCDFGDARSCGCNPLVKRCIEPDRRALPIDFSSSARGTEPGWRTTVMVKPSR